MKYKWSNHLGEYWLNKFNIILNNHFFLAEIKDLILNISEKMTHTEEHLEIG